MRKHDDMSTHTRDEKKTPYTQRINYHTKVSRPTPEQTHAIILARAQVSEKNGKTKQNQNKKTIAKIKINSLLWPLEKQNCNAEMCGVVYATRHDTTTV